jgi:hypothetical protein
MSIVNMAIRDDAAILVTDSGGLVDQRQRKISKVCTLPHFPAVISGRGASLVTSLVYMYVNEKAETFDEAIVLMPHIIRHAMETVRGVYPPIELSVLKGIEIMLVGWSAAEDRPAGYAWTKYGLESDIVRHVCYGAFFAPGGSEVQTRYDAALQRGEQATWLTLARIQREVVLEQEPHLAGSGPLLQTRITKDRIVIDRIGELGAEDGGS